MGIDVIGQLDVPGPLAVHHNLDQFTYGVSNLDDWLKKRSRSNERKRASRTYVLCNDKRVIGYYSLATGALARKDAPRTIRRNMPTSIPIMVLASLAIDHEYQGNGLGDALLRDAIIRIMQAASIAGIKAVLVHAISEEAKKFYLERGFIICPAEPMTLLLLLESITKMTT